MNLTTLKTCKAAAKDIAYFKYTLQNDMYASIIEKAHLAACGNLCDLGELIKQYRNGLAPTPNATSIVFEKPLTGKFKHSKRDFFIEKVEGENAVIRYKGERGTYDVKVKDLKDSADIDGDINNPVANTNSVTIPEFYLQEYLN